MDASFGLPLGVYMGGYYRVLIVRLEIRQTITYLAGQTSRSTSTRASPASASRAAAAVSAARTYGARSGSTAASQSRGGGAATSTM